MAKRENSVSVNRMTMSSCKMTVKELSRAFTITRRPVHAHTTHTSFTRII